jgi:hypothetical protein
MCPAFNVITLPCRNQGQEPVYWVFFRSGTNYLVRLLTSKGFPTRSTLFIMPSHDMFSYWQYYINDLPNPDTIVRYTRATCLVRLLGSEGSFPRSTSSMMKFFHSFSHQEYFLTVCPYPDASFRFFVPSCPPCHTHTHTSLRLTHFTPSCPPCRSRLFTPFCSLLSWLWFPGFWYRFVLLLLNLFSSGKGILLHTFPHMFTM